MLKKSCLLSVVLLTSVFLVGCGSKEPAKEAEAPPAEPQAQQTPPPPAAPADPNTADVVMKPTQGNTAAGTIHFERHEGEMHVEMQLTGLPAGRHGFHIHENGDCSAPDAASAGGHFNPENKPHGMPGFGQYHQGDLGNLEVGADGTVKTDMHYKFLMMEGPNSIHGKSVVIHAAPDDLKTQPSGNSGARIACGVIP